MTAPTPVRRGNPAGVASLVFSVLLLLADIAAQVFGFIVYDFVFRIDLDIRMGSILLLIPQVLLATIATVTGIIGLRLRDRPRVAAIIGTTMGAYLLIAVLCGFVGSTLVKLVLF